MAVRTRDVATLRRLCSSTSEHLPAALKRRDGQGHTLMHWAAKSGDVAMLELLASEYGAVVDLSVTTACLCGATYDELEEEVVA